MQLPDIPDVEAWKRFVRGAAASDDTPFVRVIELVWEQHGLGRPAEPLRAARGSTPVFFVGDLVIKCVPHPFCAEAFRETGALREVFGGLPVRTPEVIASGAWGPWRYLVSTRIRGCSVRDIGALSNRDRCSVSEQVGALLRVLHELPADGFHEGHCEWARFIEERVAYAPGFQREHHLHPDAVDTLGSWFGAARLINDDRRSVLHGDLHHEHVLLDRVGADVSVVGIIDFGDGIVGHPEYDLVTPMFFIAAADKDAQRALLNGYGYNATRESSHRLTALSALHQFNALARFLPDPHGADALDVIRERYWSMASVGRETGARPTKIRPTPA